MSNIDSDLMPSLDNKTLSSLIQRLSVIVEVTKTMQQLQDLNIDDKSDFNRLVERVETLSTQKIEKNDMSLEEALYNTIRPRFDAFLNYLVGSNRPINANLIEQIPEVSKLAITCLLHHAAALSNIFCTSIP